MDHRVDEAEGEVQEVQVPGSDQPCDCEVGKIIKPRRKKMAPMNNTRTDSLAGDRELNGAPQA